MLVEKIIIIIINLFNSFGFDFDWLNRSCFELENGEI